MPSDFADRLIYFQEFFELDNAHELLEIGRDDNIYTMEIGECYQSGLFYFFFQRAGVYTFTSASLPADNSAGLQSLSQRRGAGTQNGELGTSPVLLVKVFCPSELQVPCFSRGGIETDLRNQ